MLTSRKHNACPDYHKTRCEQLLTCHEIPFRWRRPSLANHLRHSQIACLQPIQRHSLSWFHPSHRHNRFTPFVSELTLIFTFASSTFEVRTICDRLVPSHSPQMSFSPYQRMLPAETRSPAAKRRFSVAGQLGSCRSLRRTIQESER